jgi:hypothetical protein
VRKTCGGALGTGRPPPCTRLQGCTEKVEPGSPGGGAGAEGGELPGEKLRCARLTARYAFPPQTRRTYRMMGCAYHAAARRHKHRRGSARLAAARAVRLYGERRGQSQGTTCAHSVGRGRSRGPRGHRPGLRLKAGGPPAGGADPARLTAKDGARLDLYVLSTAGEAVAGAAAAAANRG